MTFEELMQLRIQHLQGLRRQASTLYNHRLALQDFVNFCQEQCLDDVNQLQASHFSTYLARLKEQPLTRLVQYSRQRQLRTWLAWGTYRGHLFLDASKDFLWKHPPLLPRGAPSEAQVDALLQAPDDSLLGRRDQALMEFLYGTGARSGECVATDVADLDFQSQTVLIRHGKGGRQRTLPLGSKLCQVLQAYLDQVRPSLNRYGTEALWISGRGNRLENTRAYGRIRGWSQSIGLDLGPHSLRHAMATHLLARGAPIVAVQRLLGHVTLNMTTRYTHLVVLDLQKTLSQHHPRAKKKQTRKPRTE